MATPVLAGRVINAIIDGKAERIIITLASLIAVLAVLEGGLTILNRWLSSTIGAGPVSYTHLTLPTIYSV